jgi:hypothetical protein
LWRLTWASSATRVRPGAPVPFGVNLRAILLVKGPLTGSNPVDRGKPGSKLHVLTDRSGLPLAVAVSAANTHDSLALIPLVQAVPAIRSRHGRRRRRPDKLHARLGL